MATFKSPPSFMLYEDLTKQKKRRLMFKSNTFLTKNLCTNNCNNKHSVNTKFSITSKATNLSD
jgi:hypothetical protein